MTTTRTHETHGAPRIPAVLPPFRTPVRGHAYAPRLPGTPAPVPGQSAALVPEPGNPADPHAVAVWVGEEGRRWRIGYLDRGVAARVAPRLQDGVVLRARVDGWAREPEGRWQRPVVLLQAEAPSGTTEQGAPRGGRERARAGQKGEPTGQGRERSGQVRERSGQGRERGGEGREVTAAPQTPQAGTGTPRVWGRPPGVARRTLGPARPAASRDRG